MILTKQSSPLMLEVKGVTFIGPGVIRANQTDYMLFMVAPSRVEVCALCAMNIQAFLLFLCSPSVWAYVTYLCADYLTLLRNSA